MFPAGAGTTFGHRLFRVLPRLGMMGRGISGRLLFSAFRRRPPAGAESTRTIGRRWKEKGAVELLEIEATLRTLLASSLAPARPPMATGLWVEVFPAVFCSQLFGEDLPPGQKAHGPSAGGGRKKERWSF